MIISVVDENGRTYYKRTPRSDRKYEPKCSVPGCNVNYQSGGLCSKHYYRLHKLGDIDAETRFDKNEYTIIGNTVKITLKNKDLKIVGYTMIDTEDMKKVLQYKWYLKKGNGYVHNSCVGYLHSFLMGKGEPGKVVDHKDDNKLNNRKNNFRWCNNGTNIQKAPIFRSNTSGYRGVCFCKRIDKWGASITSAGKAIHLGHFEDKVLAAKAYDRKAIELFGKYAYINNA